MSISIEKDTEQHLPYKVYTLYIYITYVKRSLEVAIIVTSGALIKQY